MEYIKHLLSNKEPFDFNKVVTSLCSQYAKRKEWQGEDICVSNLLIVCPKLSESLSPDNMEYRKNDKAESYLFQIIKAAIHLGMEQQARIINKEINKI